MTSSATGSGGWGSGAGTVVGLEAGIGAGQVEGNMAARRSAGHALRCYLGVGGPGGSGGRRIWCFTDPGRLWLARAFADEAAELGLSPFVVELPGSRYGGEDMAAVGQVLRGLAADDVVLSVFSGQEPGDDSGGGSRAHIPFQLALPNLRGPEGFQGVSCCIRQRIPDAALLEQLMTDPASVEAAVGRWRAAVEGAAVAGAAMAAGGVGLVRVTTPAGTDVMLRSEAAKVLPYGVGVSAGERHAFLPPSEISFGVAAGSANGVVVADVTVGEFVVVGRAPGIEGGGDGARVVLLDRLGLVDEPVRLVVRDGYVTGIEGGAVARRLRRCFEGLGRECRLVVELGFGLAWGSPTGAIGADECLQGTCHFGVGDDGFYGNVNPAPVHLDVVCRGPEVGRVR